ncbi:hypothetical protein [Arthrobacter bambusae]|uniref:hypothetical protein n=1 Tax=Arthrobacter bambusae TaxID=1338426 RepID=UPI002783852D|nr:hypothetical protein [Arthrobacter bambusae]MDQ0031076.1 hypothetical protein [Arthrobacter bambusae]MDQ0098791.1 hypothetical protein [Arthrobacter bambusae]
MIPDDDTGRAAVGLLLRIAFEESDAPGRLAGRMRQLIAELVENRGQDGPAELAITPAFRPP